MEGPFVPHHFGDAVSAKLRSRLGWLTAGVASSIAWPKSDVWIVYDGSDYVLRGYERNGQPSPPGISVACEANRVDEALARIYRFTSILGWFCEGYADVGAYVWGSHPVLAGGARQVFSTLGSHGEKSFNCNYMPLVDSEQKRHALAFWREGLRLKGVHDGYSFLSFHKVVESQFQNGRAKARWINENIALLNGPAAERVEALQAAGVDVGEQLFVSGRCAVTHASLGGEIVDPDIPSDRRRLSEDLVVMRGLAERYIRNELGISTARDVWATRNRLAPWETLLQPGTLEELKRGGEPQDYNGLDGLRFAICMWPDGPIDGLENMTLVPHAVDRGRLQILGITQDRGIALSFVLDFTAGRAHTQLSIGGLEAGNERESDAKAFITYYAHTVGNGQVQLLAEGRDPVDCEIVIPVNIIPEDPQVVINRYLEAFRQGRERGAASLGDSSGAEASAGPE